MFLKNSLLGLICCSVIQSGFAAQDIDALRVIIKYKQQPKAFASLKSRALKYAHVPVKKIVPMANGAFVLVFEPSKDIFAASKTQEQTSVVLENLRQDPLVLYAVKDRIGHFKPVPDPTTSEMQSSLLTHESQWDEFARPAGIMLESKAGLNDGAWAYTTGNAKKPVVVAVLDTGIALHESLVNNLVKDETGQVWGWNFARNNNNLMDETASYHGTHVAGTIAGYGNVMLGIGADLKVLPIKIPDDSGMFYESAVVNAIYWAVGATVPGAPTNRYPASVLNMSFGVDEKPGKEIDYCDQAMQEAVFFARKSGAVLIAAAGNDNTWDHFYAPASCNGTIKVASTGPQALRSYFSNYGPSVTLAAPGGDKRYGTAGGILSTVNPGGGYNNSGYDFYQGTSMASPHVAGVAGLIYAISEKRLKAEEVEQLLYVTTHDFGQSTDPNKSCRDKKPCGHGILDAENAVKAALAGYDLLVTAPPAPMLYAHKSVEFGGARWIQQSIGSDIRESAISHPQVKQGPLGEIIADYGTVRYVLDKSVFRECHIIGFDGVGCVF